MMAGNTPRPLALGGLSKWILNKIVQKHHVSSSTKTTIKQLIADNLVQTADRCWTLFEDLLAANKTEKEMKLYNCHMEEYLIQNFRQRRLELLESKDTPQPDDTYLHALHIHSDILQEELRLNETLLLYRLIEKDAMSEDGRESILSRKTNQQKNAAFIKYVSQTFNANTFKTRFLPVFKEEYEDLATELSEAAENPTFSKSLLHLCPSCKIREQIRIRKFATCLYRIGAITEASHLDLTSTYMSHEDKWNHLKHKTRQNPSVLMQALKSYNAGLYDQLSSKRRLLLECTCQDEMNSTIGQCSDTTDSDIARMSDVSDSSSQMEMETEIYAGAAAPLWGEDAFPSGSGTSSLSGSDNEPEGQHTPLRIMKGPLSPVNKENPFFAPPRRPVNRSLQRIRREHSQSTRRRCNNEIRRHGLTRPVDILEVRRYEVDNYNCTKGKRKRTISDLDVKDEEPKAFWGNKTTTIKIKNIDGNDRIIPKTRIKMI